MSSPAPTALDKSHLGNPEQSPTFEVRFASTVSYFCVKSLSIDKKSRGPYSEQNTPRASLHNTGIQELFNLFKTEAAYQEGTRVRRAVATPQATTFSSAVIHVDYLGVPQLRGNHALWSVFAENLLKQF
jgi:hypothetical protein